jgi:CheY-like chemotaxis protein
MHAIARPHILIAEDDADLRLTLRMALEDAGFEVIEAADGMATLDTLTHSPTPLVVLLDLLMPKMSGAQVLQRASADPTLMARHVFIVLTAGPYTRQRTEPGFMMLLDQHAIPTVAKPFELDALIELVERLSSRLLAG